MAVEKVYLSADIDNDAIGAEHIDESDTDIRFSQIALTPKPAGIGVIEATIYYSSVDRHLYVYVPAE